MGCGEDSHGPGGTSTSRDWYAKDVHSGDGLDDVRGAVSVNLREAVPYFDCVPLASARQRIAEVPIVSEIVVERMASMAEQISAEREGLCATVAFVAVSGDENTFDVSIEVSSVDRRHVLSWRGRGQKREGILRVVTTATAGSE
jgi:hypothetical protein